MPKFFGVTVWSWNCHLNKGSWFELKHSICLKTSIPHSVMPIDIDVIFYLTDKFLYPLRYRRRNCRSWSFSCNWRQIWRCEYQPDTDSANVSSIPHWTAHQGSALSVTSTGASWLVVVVWIVHWPHHHHHYHIQYNNNNIIIIIISSSGFCVVRDQHGRIMACQASGWGQ